MSSAQPLLALTMPPSMLRRDDDKVIALNLTTWIGITVATLIALFKILSKYLKIQKLQADDYLIFVSVIFASAETYAVTRQIQYGLGQPQTDLSLSQLQGYEKSAYAAEFLFFISLALAKIAHAQFATVLSSKPFARVAGIAIIVFTIVWVTSTIFAIAFQCPLPNSYTLLSPQCFDQTAFMAAVSAFDVLIDLSLSALPIFILYDVQMRMASKIAITIAFAARLFVIPLTILRVVFFARARSNPNQTELETATVITAQLDMNLSIVATCVPFLKIVLERVEHGLFTSDLRYAPGGSSYARKFMDKTIAGLGGKNVDDLEAKPGQQRARNTSIVREPSESVSQPLMPLDMAFNPQTAVAAARGSPAVSCCSDEMYISNRMSVNVHSDRQRTGSESSGRSHQKRRSHGRKKPPSPSPYAQYDDLWEVSSEDTVVEQDDLKRTHTRDMSNNEVEEEVPLDSKPSNSVMDSPTKPSSHDSQEEAVDTTGPSLDIPAQPAPAASSSNRHSTPISPFSWKPRPLNDR